MIQNNKLFLLLFYSVLFLFIFSFNFTLLGDPDFGWHLRYGEEVWTTKHIPVVDTYTHTVKGQSLVAYEWLPEVVFYLIFSKYSFLGLALFSAIFSSLAFFIPAVLVRGKPATKLLITFWSILGSLQVLQIGARPQNITLLFISCLNILLLKFLEEKKVKYLLLLPFLFLLWANSHPGFYLGLLLLLLLLIIEVFFIVKSFFQNSKNYEYKPAILLFLFLIISLLVVGIRPRSPGSGGFSFELVKSLALPVNLAATTSSSGSVRTSIAEWLPPILTDLSGTLFLLAIVYSISLFIQKPLRKTDCRNLIILLGFIYFSTLSRRNVPFFFLVFLPFGISYSDSLIENLKKRLPYSFLNWTLLFIMLMWCLYKIPTEAKKILEKGDSTTAYCQALSYPCGAVDYIKQNKISGKMFNYYTWGGYLVWNLRQYPTFIDGRLPSGPVFSDFDTVAKLKDGWEKVLDKYDIGWIIMPKNATFEYIITNVGGWKQIFADDKAVILVRK